MHQVHKAAPDLEFDLRGRAMLVKGYHQTRAVVHAPNSIVESVYPQPYPQRVYYRHDAARGEADHEICLGTKAWDIQIPAGGGRVALVVQGHTGSGNWIEINDPWAAYDQEAARRRRLVERAWATTGVRDELC